MSDKFKSSLSDNDRLALGDELESNFKDFVFEKPHPNVHADLLESPHFTDIPAPSVTEFSWSDKPGVISASRNQGNCNACASFAACAMVEARHYLATKTVISLSPGFVHTCLGAMVCGNSLDPAVALARMQQWGTAYKTDGDYPYNPANCKVEARYQLGPMRPLQGPNDAKYTILQRGPILATMMIAKDFFSLDPQKPYSLPVGPPILQHAVCVIGFHDKLNAWVIKNSFGPTWGHNGLAMVAYQQCGMLLPPGAATPTGYPLPAYESYVVPQKVA